MMRHPSRRRCGLALCWFLAFSLVPAWPVRADETVALAFGWPSGLRGKVTFSARMTRTVDGRSEDLDMSGSYGFVTSAAADGLLIRFEDVETDVGNAGSGPEAMVKRLMAKVISMPPSYVVSPAGQFLRIEGLDAFRSGILAGMDDALAELPAATREQVTEALGAIVTREQLEAGLASDWDSHVGTWIGAELNQGELYELAFNQPIPAFGNMEVPVRTTFRFTRRVACNAAEPTERCIELEMYSFVDPGFAVGRHIWRGRRSTSA
jgi:hypothetical protein